jgi:hypothetical protein
MKFFLLKQKIINCACLVCLRFAGQWLAMCRTPSTFYREVEPYTHKPLTLSKFNGNDIIEGEGTFFREFCTVLYDWYNIIKPISF